MERATNSALWVEEGYQLFSREGLAGIQVERLARILQLNKSGFYHYFGDLEGFCTQLIALHIEKVELFLAGIRRCEQVDPDYLLLLCDHAQMVMFQVQLTRNKEHRALYEASEMVDRRLTQTIQKIWSVFIGTQHNPEVSVRYFLLVRDMFYTRISLDSLNYKFLHNFAANAKGLIDQVAVQALHERSRPRDYPVDDTV